jgi:hypothetical protein
MNRKIFENLLFKEPYGHKSQIHCRLRFVKIMANLRVDWSQYNRSSNIYMYISLNTKTTVQEKFRFTWKLSAMVHIQFIPPPPRGYRMYGAPN